MQLHSQRPGSILDTSYSGLCISTDLGPGRIEESYKANIGKDFLHKLEPLQYEVGLENRISCQVPTRA